MSNRIAPPGDYPTHGFACSFLRNLAMEIIMLNDGKGTGTLLELTREWSTYRDELLRCPTGHRGVLGLREIPNKVRDLAFPHHHIVEFVDALIRDIEVLWSWPPPKDFHIESERLEQLRALTRELDECREKIEIKY